MGVHGTEADFMYLSEPEVIKAGALDMERCISVQEEVLRLLSMGDYRMSGGTANSHGAMVLFPESSPFPNMPTAGEDRRFIAMPAYLGGEFNMAGVKWYGSNIGNRERGLPRSILMLTLNDPVTGCPVAYMSANLISAYRTGAIPAVGVRHLARPDARVLGIIGPGVMNKTFLRGVMCERPEIDTVRIKGRGAKSIERYISFVKENYPQIKNIEVVNSLEEAIRGADIVSLATNENGNGVAGYPCVEKAWVKPGALICVPSDGNADDEFLAEPTTRLITDNYEMYDTWGKEFGYPAHEAVGIIGSKFVDMVRSGAIEREKVVDLGDVIRGEKAGRESEDDVVFFSIGGMPVEDIAWGTVLYRRALKMGLGTTLKIWDKPALG